MNKVCTKCGELKDVSEFSPKKVNKNGLNSWCKACNRAATLIYYNKNKELCDFRNKEKSTPDETKVAIDAILKKRKIFKIIEAEFD